MGRELKETIDYDVYLVLRQREEVETQTLLMKPKGLQIAQYIYYYHLHHHHRHYWLGLASCPSFVTTQPWAMLSACYTHARTHSHIYFMMCSIVCTV